MTEAPDHPGGPYFAAVADRLGTAYLRYAFDADAGSIHELAAITTKEGATERVDLWTGVYTPRELRLLALGVGLVPEKVWAVEPGGYADRRPDLEHPSSCSSHAARRGDHRSSSRIIPEVRSKERVPERRTFRRAA